MLKIVLPSPNKPSLVNIETWKNKYHYPSAPPTPHVPSTVKPINPNPITELTSAVWETAKKRDDIVKKLYKDCPYNVGDICKPVNPDKRYSNNISITAICKSLTDMGKDYQWPKDDNPMIVHAYDNEKKFPMFCTTNFLTKA